MDTYTRYGLNTLDDSKDGIEKYLCRNPDTCFVAEETNEIIGLDASGHDGRRGFIYYTAVKENFRGKGIGKKLVEAAMKALEKEGIRKVALVVFAKNELGNACSHDANAMKNHYLMTQIADMIKQLYEWFYLKKNGIKKSSPFKVELGEVYCKSVKSCGKIKAILFGIVRLLLLSRLVFK